MCGISAIVERGGAPANEAWLQIANARLRHRGPDGHRTFARGSIGVAHTRLSIVDIDGGAQPLFNEDETIALVCNGEIYNHRALRAELVARGHRFRTHSDCETILHAYEDDPHGYVSRLVGMFAFILVDWRRGEVQLVRDHVGIKPLFFRLDEKRLLASSEAKAILAHAECAPRLDGRVVHDFLTFGYTAGDKTVFEGIEAVPPATRMIWSTQSELLSKDVYWRPDFEPRDPGDPDAFRALFGEIVRDHTSGDVDVGVYLSGGLDSSIIAATLALAPSRKQSTPVPAFSLSFSDPRFDESVFARTVASAFGLRGHDVPVHTWEIGDLARAVYFLEAPQIVTLDIANMRLSAATRAAGIKPVMAGDGADELLGGYDHFTMERMRRRLAGGAAAATRAELEGALGVCGYPPDFAEHYVGVASDAARITEQWGVFPPWYPIWSINDRIKAPLTAGAWPSSLGREGPLDHVAAPLRGQLAHLPEQSRGLWLEMMTRLPNWILWRTDRDAMANSVEVRVPYLDVRSIGALCGLRESRADGPAEGKSFLRRAFAGMLPPEIVGRRKHAFNTPMDWLFREGSRTLEALLGPTMVREAGLFEPQGVTNLLAEVRSTGPGARSMLHAIRAQTLIGVLTAQMLHVLYVASGGSSPDALEAMS